MADTTQSSSRSNPQDPSALYALYAKPDVPSSRPGGSQMIKRMPSHKYSAHLARWGNQLRHRMGGPTRSYDLTYDGKYYKLSPLCLVLEEHTHR